jgi:hypothetical protein
MSLFVQSSFSVQERRSNKEMQLAFEKSRKKHTISKQDLQLTEACSALDLCCVNDFARIRWGRAFCQEFEEFFRLDHENGFPDRPLFFVTLTDISCTTDHDASSIEISKFKRKLQAGLRGLNYAGMVEPGLYVNVCPGTRWSGKKAVSWHLHAICWGENRKQIKSRFSRLNRDGWYLSILESQRGADQKEILDARLPKNRDRTFLADKLRYLLKSPRKAYRVYRTERMTSDGELVPCFRQRKSELRKGDRITLFHLLKGLHLDQLAAAGGEGTDMMRRIKRRAVRVRPIGGCGADFTKIKCKKCREIML